MAVFVSVAVVQLAAAVVFLRAGGRRASLAMAVTTVVLLAAWVVSRTVGLPIGHSHGPERAAALDITAASAQVIVLFALVPGSRRALSWRAGIAALAVVLAAVGVVSRTQPSTDHHGPRLASTPSALDDSTETEVRSPAPSSSDADTAPVVDDHSDEVEPHDHP